MRQVLSVESHSRTICENRATPVTKLPCNPTQHKPAAACTQVPHKPQAHNLAAFISMDASYFSCNFTQLGRQPGPVPQAQGCLHNPQWSKATTHRCRQTLTLRSNNPQTRLTTCCTGTCVQLTPALAAACALPRPSCSPQPWQTAWLGEPGRHPAEREMDG